MKKIFFLISLIVFFTSCDKILYQDGVPPRGYDDKIFTINNFDRIEINNAFMVTIKKGTKNEVQVKGSSEDIDDLEISVINKKLEVKYDNRIRLKKIQRYKMEVVIITQDITEIISKSASDTEVSGFTGLKTLNVKVSGASKLRIKNEVDKLFAEISGASTLVLPLKVKEIEAELKGASTLTGFESNSEKAFLNLTGASKADVSVSVTLDIVANGASKINYKGSPLIKEKLSGGAKVSKSS